MERLRKIKKVFRVEQREKYYWQKWLWPGCDAMANLTTTDDLSVPINLNYLPDDPSDVLPEFVLQSDYDPDSGDCASSCVFGSLLCTIPLVLTVMGAAVLCVCSMITLVFVLILLLEISDPVVEARMRKSELDKSSAREMTSCLEPSPSPNDLSERALDRWPHAGSGGGEQQLGRQFDV